MSDPQKKYEQIEALLRLAEDPNATEAEQARAQERAAAIAAKYQIDASKLDPNSGQYIQEDVVSHVFPVPTSYDLNRMRGRGLFQVVESMGARSYVRDVYGRKNVEETVVYATESTMNILKVLIPSLIIQEANASAAYIRKFKQENKQFQHLQDSISDLRKAGVDPKVYATATRTVNSEIRRRRKSFCLAFFVEAAKRVEEKRSDAVQHAGEKYALVLVDTADRINQAMADLDLRSLGTRKSYWNADAWGKGSEAGASAMVGQTEVYGGRIALER